MEPIKPSVSVSVQDLARRYEQKIKEAQADQRRSHSSTRLSSDLKVTEVAEKKLSGIKKLSIGPLDNTINVLTVPIIEKEEIQEIEIPYSTKEEKQISHEEPLQTREAKQELKEEELKEGNSVQLKSEIPLDPQVNQLQTAKKIDKAISYRLLLQKLKDGENFFRDEWKLVRFVDDLKHKYNLAHLSSNLPAAGDIILVKKSKVGIEGKSQETLAAFEQLLNEAQELIEKSQFVEAYLLLHSIQDSKWGRNIMKKNMTTQIIFRNLLTTTIQQPLLEVKNDILRDLISDDLQEEMKVVGKYPVHGMLEEKIPEYKAKCPHFAHLSEISSNLSDNCIVSILSGNTEQERSLRLKYFIELGRQTLKEGNYFVAQPIFVALTHDFLRPVFNKLPIKKQDFLQETVKMLSKISKPENLAEMSNIPMVNPLRTLLETGDASDSLKFQLTEAELTLEVMKWIENGQINQFIQSMQTEHSKIDQESNKIQDRIKQLRTEDPKFNQSEIKNLEKIRLQNTYIQSDLEQKISIGKKIQNLTLEEFETKKQTALAVIKDLRKKFSAEEVEKKRKADEAKIKPLTDIIDNLRKQYKQSELENENPDSARWYEDNEIKWEIRIPPDLLTSEQDDLVLALINFLTKEKHVYNPSLMQANNVEELQRMEKSLNLKEDLPKLPLENLLNLRLAEIKNRSS